MVGNHGHPRGCRGSHSHSVPFWCSVPALRALSAAQESSPHAPPRATPVTRSRRTDARGVDRLQHGPVAWLRTMGTREGAGEPIPVSMGAGTGQGVERSASKKSSRARARHTCDAKRDRARHWRAGQARQATCGAPRHWCRWGIAAPHERLHCPGRQV